MTETAIETTAHAQQVAERLRRTRILLSTLDDYLPSMPYKQLAVTSGPVASRRVPCEECSKRGVVGGHICTLCGGHGWRLRHAGDDFYDEYTGELVARASGEQQAKPVRTMSAAELDAQIAQLEQTRREREGVVDKRAKYGWELARERQEQTGSYAETRRALERLRESRPDAYRVARRVASYPLEQELSEREQEALAAVALNLPGVIRVPFWALERHFADRRQSARELHARGLSLSKIARQLGIERGKVKKLIGASEK